MPVLFLPGHAGSYQQVRSLASETARQMQRARLMSRRRADAAASCPAAPHQQPAAGDGVRTESATGQSDESSDAARCLDAGAGSADGGTESSYTDLAWYAADFNGELSAFDGKLLV